MAHKKTGKKTTKKKASTNVARRPATHPKGFSADQARDLGDNFEAISDALRQWRRENTSRLSNDQIKQLRYLQLTILHNADSLTTVAVGLTLDEAAVSLNQLIAATNKAEEAIETIEGVKRVIEIASATISLAASIMAKDVGSTAKSAAALFKLVTEDNA